MSVAKLETNFIDVHFKRIYIYMHNAAVVGLMLVTYTNI